MTRDLPVRSILKALSWRISGSVATAALVYFATGAQSLAMMVGGAEATVKLLLFYLHERLWELVSFGRCAPSPAQASVRTP